MRIFIALDIDNGIRERIVRFVDGVGGFAPDARWVRPESLHVTLKFIGEQSAEAVEQVKQELARAKTGTIEIQFRGYGFFPGAKAPRVFWIGIEAGEELALLARAIDGRMASLGIPKEEHAFSPHLTLARGKGGSGSPKWSTGDGPNRGFKKLQEKLETMPVPEFGTMTARSFFLYQSRLSPKGSVYTKLAEFAFK